MKLRVLILTMLAVAAGLCWPNDARAQGDRYAVIVQGTSGGDPFAGTYRKWVTSLVGTLREKFGFDPAHLTVLTDQPGAGEQVANAANVKAAFAKVAGQAKDGDLLFVLLMGHGGGDGADAKFNLVGPDLTVIEWSVMLSPTSTRNSAASLLGSAIPCGGTGTGVSSGSSNVRRAAECARPVTFTTRDSLPEVSRAGSMRQPSAFRTPGQRAASSTAAFGRVRANATATSRGSVRA